MAAYANSKLLFTGQGTAKERASADAIVARLRKYDGLPCENELFPSIMLFSKDKAVTPYFASCLRHMLLPPQGNGMSPLLI